jgi:hypothetical protein
MKRLTVVLVAALAVGALTGQALAGGGGLKPVSPTVAKQIAADGPYPASSVGISLYSDTVTSTRGAVIQKRGCAQTNYFPRNSRAVFRMWAVDGKTGQPITDADVQYVYIKIPGLPNQALTWGGHGSGASKVYFWSLGWGVPVDYPLGAVNFRIVLKTTDGRFGVYTQPQVDGSQMTVTT